MLKLDFRKAFDSVSWPALAAIMLAKGFPMIWCNWVDSLNRSSQSAVVLNGKPGPWINCKQGLRQGDSLSPYLFIIVADVLQRLIYQASNDGRLAHPINQELPCPALQYADDTLIILPAEAAQLQSLKDILLQFSQATGLHINFHKSTFAPIHVPPELANDLANIFGCNVGTMPFTYLGLPLGTTKPTIQEFMPLVCKMERRLTATIAMMSYGGRLSWLNASVTSLLVFAMCTLKFPPKLIEILDKIRRRCLWKKKTDQGDKCNSLAAWELVCKPKSKGGLGVINIQIHNDALLLKFLHKFYNKLDVPWVTML